MTLNPAWPALSGVIEALLFVTDRPLSENDIVEVLMKQRDEDIELAEENEEAQLAVEASAETTVEAPSDEHATVLASNEDAVAPLTAIADDAGLSSESLATEVPLYASDAPANDGAIADESLAADAIATPETSEALAEESLATATTETSDAPANDDAASEPFALEAEDAPRRQIADVPLDEVVSVAQPPKESLPKDPRVELRQAVKAALQELMQAYEAPSTALGQGFELVAVAGGYQLRTAARAASFIRHFLQVKPTRLSRAQLETLAIVAYRQPVTRPEIEQIRGVDCGASMKTLLERKLVRILGKKEEVGRPLLYGTTKEFLEFFNLNGLMELPTLREFQELSEEHQRKVEEELDRDKPLGSMKELAEQAPQLSIDDSAMIGDLDAALSNARQTVNRVAEVTGLKPVDDDAAPAPARE